MLVPDVSQWISLVEILTRLPKRLQTWFASAPAELLAALEQSDADDKQDIQRIAERIVHDQAKIAIMVMADYVEGIFGLLHRDNHLVFSPWVLARAVQEQASKVLWVLNPHLSTQEGFARSLNMRLGEQRTQIKVARGENDDAIVQRIKSRMLELSDMADQLGISTKGKREIPNHYGTSGILTILDRVKKTMQEDTDYRILSAIVHGELWASLQIGFQQDEDNRYSPDLTFEVVVYLISRVAGWFAKAHWAYGDYYGFDLEKLRTILEEEYERAGLSEPLRFWRAYSERK